MRHDTTAPGHTHHDDTTTASTQTAERGVNPAAPADLDRVVVVFDTSTLISDPTVLYAHPGCDIVLPLTVIEELDRLKHKLDTAAGAAARTVIRELETIRTAGTGTLTTSCPFGEDATLRVEPNGLRLEELSAFHLDPDVADHRILASALGLAGDGRTVELISGDAAMRLKADALGLPASDHIPTAKPFSCTDQPGWHTAHVTEKTVTDAYAGGWLPRDADPALDGIAVNEFVVAKSHAGSALLRARADKFELLKTERNKSAVWGLRPRNKEQRFALELLTDPAVNVVALSGQAGTGKTLLALAAALEQTFEADAIYDRIMILRPMYSVGRQDLGFLPGEVEDKVAPWFDAVVDSMVALSREEMDHKTARDTLTMWVEQGKLTMEPVTFLRGRSLQNTLLIVDEVQNLERGEIKTVLTRVGEGSKIVACGDPDQCDNPFTSPTANGMTALAEAFHGQELFGHVALTECERSPLADLAAKLL